MAFTGTAHLYTLYQTEQAWLSELMELETIHWQCINQKNYLQLQMHLEEQSKHFTNILLPFFPWYINITPKSHYKFTVPDRGDKYLATSSHCESIDYEQWCILILENIKPQKHTSLTDLHGTAICDISHQNTPHLSLMHCHPCFICSKVDVRLCVCVGLYVCHSHTRPLVWVSHKHWLASMRNKFEKKFSVAACPFTAPDKMVFAHNLSKHTEKDF